MKALRILFLIVLAITIIALLTPVTFSIAAGSLSVYLDKPDNIVKKTDKLKLIGYIGGLEAGKSYIMRVQVFEDGGASYSPPAFHSFTVEN